MSEETLIHSNDHDIHTYSWAAEVPLVKLFSQWGLAWRFERSIGFTWGVVAINQGQRTDRRYYEDTRQLISEARQLAKETPNVIGSFVLSAYGSELSSDNPMALRWRRGYDIISTWHNRLNQGSGICSLHMLKPDEQLLTMAVKASAPELFETQFNQI